MPIVCGTDLSESSHEALAAAVAIATRRGDSELLLVNVLDSASAADDAARDALVSSARRRIDADAARFATGTSLTIRSEVLVGPAVPTLLAFAETEGAEIVVVSSKGYTNSPIYRLGGTSERVAQASETPVLVVRDAKPFTAWAQGERALKVLVGVDESASCEAALRFVKALRRIGPADIILGQVYYADEAARRYGLKVSSLVDPNPEIERLLSRDLERRFGTAGGQGALVARPMRGLGRIGDHLLELADAEAVDLVVVGTRHRGGLGRLASVSSLVLHDARQSVMCIPPVGALADSEVPTIRVAVVATDLSDFGNRAVPYAYGLVGERGEVHLVHVIESHGPDEAALKSHLEHVAPRAAASIPTFAHVVRGDDPARCIAETAERVGADVICIASHGRSGLSRALVGSVADKLLRACRQPVLVLRPPDE
jgi:nucleotide-binding universal stress UspA family protein